MSDEQNTTDRAAIARIAENLACIAGIIADGAQPTDARRRLEIVNDGVDVALAMRRLADSLRASEDAPDAAPTPPPIPLGAVVDDLDGSRWGWDGETWRSDGLMTVGAYGWMAPYLTALYHARRERDEALRRAQFADAEWQEARDERDQWQIRAEQAEHERDAARRELAAVNGNAQGDSRALDDPLRQFAAPSPAPASAPLAAQKETANSLISENAAEKENTPASAPRRWWLVVDKRGAPSGWEMNEPEATHLAVWMDRTRPDSAPHAVVPVIEARVTRETVERVAAEIRFAPRCVGNLSEIYARAALSTLGLTVEE